MNDKELGDFIYHMYECIDKDGKDLSEWEENFIESTRKQFMIKGTLSIKQREILERIYAEKTK